MAATYFIFLLFFAGLFLFTLSDETVGCDTSKCLEQDDVSPPSCGDEKNELRNCVEEGLKFSARCNEEEKNKTNARLDALRIIEESYCGEENFQNQFEMTKGCWKPVARCAVKILSTFLQPMAVSDKRRDPNSAECKDVNEGLDNCKKMSAGACRSKEFRIKFYESVERVSLCGSCNLLASVSILLLFIVGNLFLFN